MSALRSLVPVAVVGTARRQLGPGADAAAHALLADAARAAVGMKVAIPEGSVVDAAGPAPETLPAPSSPFYVDSLQQAIGGQRWQPVIESLRFLAATGQRLPVGVLQSLLDEAVARADLRPALWPVLGACGRWLVERNPTWQFPEWTQPEPDLWADPSARADLPHISVGDPADSGGPADPAGPADLPEVTRWLSALRRTDPNGAREFIAERLLSAPAAERQALIDVLRTGLGPADEPLLEETLADRSSGVRGVVRQLLALLPESGFVARMRERVRLRVRVINARWSVDFDDLGPVDERDGVVIDVRERPPGADATRVLVAGVPLATWQEELNLSPIDLLRLTAHPLRLGPLPGLRDAAVRERDAGLAHAILLEPRWPVEAPLLELLEPEAVDAVLARRVLAEDPHDLAPMLRLRGFGRATTLALLVWSTDHRNQGRRAPILRILGDHGPISTADGDLAMELRQRAAAFMGADRARALDAAMTINLRRALRAEAAPATPCDAHTHASRHTHAPVEQEPS